MMMAIETHLASLISTFLQALGQVLSVFLRSDVIPRPNAVAGRVEPARMHILARQCSVCNFLAASAPLFSVLLIIHMVRTPIVVHLCNVFELSLHI
jgi:hypothetical protein